MPENATPILSPEIVDKWAKVRLAHEAVMLQDAKELLAKDRRATAEHLKTMLRVDAPTEGDDDMGGIHIGDVIVTQPNPQQAAPTPTANGKSSWLKTAALVALGLATGGAGTAIGGLALNWLFPDKPVVQPSEPSAPGLEHGGVKIEPFKVGS